MPFASYRLLVLFGKSFVIFHIIGIIIIDIVRRWRGLSCFLGVSVGAPWKWDKACRRQRVDHFRGTVHWHTGTQPQEPTPRFPSCSQTCARATSPQPLCDPFRARQVFVCCVWILQTFVNLTQHKILHLRSWSLQNWFWSKMWHLSLLWYWQLTDSTWKFLLDC